MHREAFKLNRDAKVEQFLSVWHVIHRHIRRHPPVVAETITRVQWMMLRHLHRSEGATIGGLADTFGVRPSTVSQMIDRLERDGWVKRHPDQNDARVKIVNLTDGGQALLAEARSKGMSRISQALEQLSGDELDTLIRLLANLSDSLAALDNQGV